MNSRRTLEAMATALRVHPTELSGQPWAPREAVSSEAHAGLMAIETALELCELGTDPELPVRAWPEIQADLDRLVKLIHWTGDYAAMGELVPALLGELHSAYLQLPQRHREVLLGLMEAHSVAMWTTKLLGGRGLPALAARAVQQCAEALGDPVWLGHAAWLRGDTTGHLDRAGQYRRSVAAAENLTGMLDGGDALQACGELHLSPRSRPVRRLTTPRRLRTWRRPRRWRPGWTPRSVTGRTCGSGRPTSASGAPQWQSSSASPARPSRSRRQCTPSCCPPPATR
ncbi:MAG: hypothetical protein ACRDRI_15180 [Pseudonocardiaceae bacterium]